ncbi:MAG: selenide, water dikinase SelD [Pirellulaceae bacterium]
MKKNPLPKNRIVLLGAGHTNSHIIREWGMGRRIERCELVCISNFAAATYSGMLPAVVAGDFSREAMEIDLLRLAQRMGCRLVLGDVQKVDREKRQLHFLDRAPLDYDVLSIGIGSQPTFADVDVRSDKQLVAIKPMQTFLDRLAVAAQHCSGSTLRISVVGGGVASAEIACCMKARLSKPPQSQDRFDQAFRKFSQVEMSIVSGDVVGLGLEPSTRWRLDRALQAAGIRVVSGQRVVAVNEGFLIMADQSQVQADLIVWATSAVGPQLLSSLGLEVDDRGFLLTNSDLTTTNDRRIFAVGDSGTIKGTKTPKAGVFAVRQGPVLFENLGRVISGDKTVSYLPQTGFLKLLNVGNQQAIGEYRGVSFSGNWPWRLKQRIDVRFMKMYQDYSLAVGDDPSGDEFAMKCLGCGGKVSADILHGVLSSITPTANDSADILIGLKEPDDAAVIKIADEQLAITTDQFATPFDDPYLFGRIVTIHSQSDLFAMGAKPFGALANVEIPFGNPRGQRRVISELMQGIAHELNESGTALLGGHSIEGPRLTAGLTVLGKQLTRPTGKGNLRAGDRLVLTKPLGVGLGLAALMQNKLHGEEYRSLIDQLLQNNSIALELIKRFDITAMTDVTGFGLLGHLVEMLAHNDLCVTLELTKIPYCSFTQRLVEQKIESTLAPSNQAFVSSFGVDFNAQDWQVAALFDPQTCGGLLVAINESKADELVSFLRKQGFAQASALASVTAANGKALRVEFQ